MNAMGSIYALRLCPCNKIKQKSSANLHFPSLQRRRSTPLDVKAWMPFVRHWLTDLARLQELVDAPELEEERGTELDHYPRSIVSLLLESCLVSGQSVIWMSFVFQPVGSLVVEIGLRTMTGLPKGVLLKLPRRTRRRRWRKGNC